MEKRNFLLLVFLFGIHQLSFTQTIDPFDVKPDRTSIVKTTRGEIERIPSIDIDSSSLKTSYSITYHPDGVNCEDTVKVRGTIRQISIPGACTGSIIHTAGTINIDALTIISGNVDSENLFLIVPWFMDISEVREGEQIYVELTPVSSNRSLYPYVVTNHIDSQREPFYFCEKYEIK